MPQSFSDYDPRSSPWDQWADRWANQNLREGLSYCPESLILEHPLALNWIHTQLPDKCCMTQSVPWFTYLLCFSAQKVLCSFSSVQSHFRCVTERHSIPAPNYQPGQKVWLCSEDIPLKNDSRELFPRAPFPLSLVLPCLYFCMYVWCSAPSLTLLAPGLVLITHTFLPSSSSLCIISTPVVHPLIARLFKQQCSYNTSNFLFVYLFSCNHFPSFIHPTPASAAIPCLLPALCLSQLHLFSFHLYSQLQLPSSYFWVCVWVHTTKSLQGAE